MSFLKRDVNNRKKYFYIHICCSCRKVLGLITKLLDKNARVIDISIKFCFYAVTWSVSIAKAFSPVIQEILMIYNMCPPPLIGSFQNRIQNEIQMRLFTRL